LRPNLAEPETAASSPRLRILHVTPAYYPAVRYGGPIVSVHGLARSLAARGHEVHVFTTDIDGPRTSQVPLATPVDLDGVQVRYFPAGLGRRLFRAPALARTLAREIGGFDLLHLHSVFLWPTTAAARIARGAGKPYLLSPRGMLVPELIAAKSGLIKRAWIGLFERANVAGAASLHVTSQEEARALRRLALTPRRLDIRPNGIEPPALEPRACNKQGRRVLYLGRLSWKKRLDCLIRALGYAPEAELTLAGFDDEGLAARLAALAREIGVAERVHLVGPRLDAAKWALLQSADIFVLPSQQENFGVAALEAMAAGLPVIVSPGVGLAPAISHAGAGLVVESEPAALGAALARLIEQPEARARMGAAGQTLARETFGWKRIGAEMETLYLDIVAAARAP
jgi:glycosyltransferase involved in cell wall biosynthesis